MNFKLLRRFQILVVMSLMDRGNSEIVQTKPIIIADSDLVSSGFLAEELEKKQPRCYPFLSGSDEGIIKSKSDHDHYYAANLHCVNIITAPPGHKIVVNFTGQMDIEMRQGYLPHMGRQKCPYDYLQFQDGPFPFSANLTQRICGTTTTPFSISSNTGYIRIVFHTDGKTQKMGFTLRYYFETLHEDHNTKKFRSCYFYVPVRKYGEFQVRNTDFLDSMSFKNERLDCVWDVHNNFSDEKLLVRITNVMNQIHLMSVNDREISIYYTTSDQIWDDRFAVKVKDFGYLLPSWRMNIPASRVFIHLRSKNLEFVPTFSVNITVYTPPEDPISGHCAEHLFNCEDRHTCLTSSLVCDRRVSCLNGEDESEAACFGSVAQVKGPRHFGPNSMTLIAVTLVFIFLMVSTMIVFTYRKLKCRAQMANREPLIGGYQNPLFDSLAK